MQLRDAVASIRKKGRLQSLPFLLADFGSIAAGGDGDVPLKRGFVVKCLNFENRGNLKLKIMGGKFENHSWCVLIFCIFAFFNNSNKLYR